MLSQGQFLLTKFVALMLPSPILSTLGFIAKHMETACLTAKVVGAALPGRVLVSRASSAVFYNITTLKFHVFLVGYLRHLDVFLVFNCDLIIISTPTLYHKVILVS